jgi:iron complex transport system substrate-binding protein
MFQKAGLAGLSTGAGTTEETKETRTIRYLDKEYTVPAKTERIVITGSLEAMEDALVLGVKPVGAMTVGGKFPDMFAAITDAAESIGEKQQPNVETILKLKPDVILSTTKFPPDVSEKKELPPRPDGSVWPGTRRGRCISHIH